METVELKGLKYDPVLQDGNSAFSIVLSSVLKSKVGPVLRFNNSLIIHINVMQSSFFLQIKNIFTASSISHHYIDCNIVAYG